ncbi:zinc finger protein 830 [Alosa sapidissima]|uniref:zinc finger protein 830 n=1 Tax=Alosa sapidissima TaxID=34773 RepID=UPI001C098525|nr:zinc finger protein 830 [Alosa sapidissima]
MSNSKVNKGKKVVNQEELRRLMREKQRGSDRKKRVESPFAKYNSLGHLSCVLCKVPVKSEILWQAHVLGKPHKDKVAEVKGAKQPQVNNETQSKPDHSLLLKRKASETNAAPGKRLKDAGSTSSGLPPGFFDGGKKSSSLGILSGMYDDDGEDGDEIDEHDSSVAMSGKAEEVKLPSVSAGVEVAPTSGLPADFFDSGIPPAPSVSHSGSISKPDEDDKVTEKRENSAEALPEGFFDDPVRDAKVRNVDTPKDIMDKEWEDFQKAMRQVNTASDAIVAEDDEEGRLERQIDEIDEQIECYRRVEVLRDKQEVVKEKLVQAKKGVSTECSGDSDEEDEEELLHVLSRDWRAKGALA